MQYSVVAMLLLAALLAGTSHARRTYQVRIPNGDRVPDPFVSGGTWQGVGHLSKEGAGPRNPFGVDFFLNDLTWTQGLCRLDSDKDGRSNGAELGDPNCLWTQGATPQHTTGLSHPGVCEPVTTQHCRNINNNL